MKSLFPLFVGVLVQHVILCAALLHAAEPAQPWKRHVIDDSSRGTDGVRLADVNGDGLPDIVTGWEEGGVTRVYINPGPGKAREKWPSVTVGKTANVEDAVMVDLDGDGALDVVSSCEGKTRRMFAHWAPQDRRKFLDPQAWITEPLPASIDRMMWMFALPLQIDGKHGIDLVAGGKGPGAQLGWFEAPANPRKLDDWKWHPLRETGWIMSIEARDMDDDGDLDIAFTDRKGPRTGAYWLENPGHGPAQFGSWKEHLIGGAGKETMFLTLADLDQDGLEDVLVATRPDEILFLRRLDAGGKNWESKTINLPMTSGTAKGIKVADINLDGRPDIVLSCENATPPKSGVIWFSRVGPIPENRWQANDISGPEGVKFDLVQLLDLDGDGDLDIITCEETQNLGVIWYENPANGKRQK